VSRAGESLANRTSAYEKIAGTGDCPGIRTGFARRGICLNHLDYLARPARAALLVWACASSLAFAAAATAQTTDFESAVSTFERKDARFPNPPEAIVVAGSSTIRLWSGIRNDLAPLEVIPRGFGGSTADDLDYYLDRLVLVHAPRAVVIYEGDHDLQIGMTPEFILERMTSIVQRIGAALPEARIYLISVKPSPKFFPLWPQAQLLNQMIQGLCEQIPRCTYVDTASSLLLANGQANKALFRSDRVHLNAAGYLVWNGVLGPALEAGEAADILLPEFRSEDIGKVAAAGSVTTSGGVAVLEGSGIGTTETSDGFHFAWRKLTASGQITARIGAQATSSGNSVAGVMLREDLSPGARFAFAHVAPLTGAALSFRATPGGATGAGAYPQPEAGAPFWVKLVRKSATVQCFLSANGISWKDCGKVTLTGLKQTVYVGLAVSSAADGEKATAAFDNVWISGSTSLPAPSPAGDVTPPSVPEFVSAQAEGPDRIRLSWAASSDDGTRVGGYRVYRDGGATPVAVTTATQFLDAGLAAGTAYTYTVSAIDGTTPANESAPSLPASAGTFPPEP
jgi:lysophospholipase L1-like esterase